MNERPAGFVMAQTSWVTRNVSNGEAEPRDGRELSLPLQGRLYDDRVGYFGTECDVKAFEGALCAKFAE